MRPGDVAALDTLREMLRVRGTHDAETLRRGRLLIEASAVLSLFLIAAFVSSMHTHHNAVVFWGVVPGATVSCLLCITLARSGRVDVAARLLIVAMFAGTMTVAWTEGPGSPRLGAAVLCIAAVGALARPRTTIAFTLAFVISLTALALAQRAGVLHPLSYGSFAAAWLSFLRQAISVAFLTLVLRRGYDRLHAQVLEREHACALALNAAHDLNASLEARVAEATTTLAATRNWLDTRARQLSDSLTTALVAMAEKLRGFLAVETGLGPDRLADVAVAVTAVERLIAMVDRLSEHARLGVAALRPAAIDMDALVGEVAANLDRVEAERAIKWTIDTLPPAWVDPALIRTVIENLLGNAVKFTRGRQPPCIHVGFDPQAHRYFVRDNGVGFDPRAAHKLFTPFQRLHDDTAFEGHGLGLANVRRILRRSGGNVTAEGEKNHGAAILFELPAPQHQASAP